MYATYVFSLYGRLVESVLSAVLLPMISHNIRILLVEVPPSPKPEFINYIFLSYIMKTGVVEPRDRTSPSAVYTLF